MLVRSDKKKREGEGDLWIDPVIRSLDPVASKAPLGHEGRQDVLPLSRAWHKESM
jgi:hypothetical protein